MLLRDNAALNVSNIANDFALVREGEVNYWIFVERYWAGLLILLLLGLLILSALRRLIFGRSPTVIIKTADSGGNK
jgi:heme A synthase